jgi:uncharacterized protein (TIGR02996 family)
MLEADAFLANILEHPDDDAPRLVFADWLEEHGQSARAEFIRVQIELAGGPIEAHRRSFLKRREKDLLQAHRKEWLKPLYDPLQAIRGPTSPLLAPGLFHYIPSVLRARNFAFTAGILSGDEPGAVPAREETVALLSQILDPLQIQLPMENIVHCRFRRGFVELASLMATDFIRFAEGLFALVPLREIAAYNGPLQRGFGELFTCPHLRRLSGLQLHGSLSEDVLELLVNSPHAAELRRLDLHAAGIPPDQVARFLTATNLPAVRELNLSSLQVGNLSLAWLARNSNWQNLRVLKLSQTGLSDEGVLALTGPDSQLRSLTHLDLSHNSITPTGAVFLAHSPLASQLQELDLGHNHLSDSWVENLTRWPTRFLGRHSLSPWVQQLLASPLVAGLKRLNLGGHMLLREDRLALQGRFGPRLKWDEQLNPQLDEPIRNRVTKNRE